VELCLYLQVILHLVPGNRRKMVLHGDGHHQYHKGPSADDALLRDRPVNKNGRAQPLQQMETRPLPSVVDPRAWIHLARSAERTCHL